MNAKEVEVQLFFSSIFKNFRITCYLIKAVDVLSASAGISCHRVSVCPSVTSRCFTETVKRRITRTTLHNSPETRQNSNAVTPNGGTKCKWGRLNAGAVAENNWRPLTRNVVNLVRSQVYHTVSTLFVCSTFAVMQRVAWFVSDNWSLFCAFARAYINISFCKRIAKICIGLSNFMLMTIMHTLFRWMMSPST